MGYDMARAVRRFYDHACKDEVESLEGRLLLTDRQKRIVELYYHRGYDITHVADSIGASSRTVGRELSLIRTKIGKGRRYVHV